MVSVLNSLTDGHCIVIVGCEGICLGLDFAHTSCVVVLWWSNDDGHLLFKWLSKKRYCQVLPVVTDDHARALVT